MRCIYESGPGCFVSSPILLWGMQEEKNIWNSLHNAKEFPLTWRMLIANDNGAGTFVRNMIMALLLLEEG